MKKIVMVSVLSALICGAKAENLKPYVGFGAGVVMVENAGIAGSNFGRELGVETGYTFDLAAGVALPQAPVRLELQYLFQENDIDKVMSPAGDVGVNGEATIHAGFVNLYYDFSSDALPVIFSVFGGLGLANVEADIGFKDDNDTVFAYQAGFGVGYPLGDHLILDAKYAYMAAENPEFELLETEINAHRFTLGFRYQF